jgi:DNA-binding YbaB/EbfC family protein
MKGMNDLVRQAQLMQKKMAQMQEDMGKRVVEATSGGGMVTVKATGAQEIVEIKIDKAAVDPNDVEMLQDLVLAAANEALKKAKDMMQSEMSQITGGMKIPGLF